MDPMKLQVFQRQVRDHCQATIFAAEQINTALAAGDIDRVWFASQSLLTGAANASKVLWGVKSKMIEERRPVRESLTVADDSPLRSRDLRNDFEHFDERIDTWWESSRTHIFVDRNIGPPTSVSGVPDKDMFRFYDPALHEIVFWGTRYQIQPIVSEAERVFEVAEVEWAKLRGPAS